MQKKPHNSWEVLDFGLHLVVFVSGLGPGGHGSQEKLKKNRMIIHNIHITFPKITLGEILDLGLHLGVYGAGLGPDGPGCLEPP